MPLDLSVPASLVTALLPDLIVMGGAMALLLWGVWRPEGASGRPVGVGAIGVCLAALAAIAGMAVQGITAGPGPIAIDNFRWATDAVILVGTILSIALADDYGRRAEPVAVESHALTLLAASGMMLLAGARDLILVFLGIEVMSVAVYVLAGINRRSARSAEAALKYFLLGAFSTAFLLYGVALVYGATGATNLTAIGSALAASPPGPGSMAVIGLALMLVGFAFKVAAAPFHMWTPDVYDGAPTPFTAFMAAAVKAAAFASFARVFMEGFGPVFVRWHSVLWWLAALTMVLGNLIALSQRNLKRMLAYSSIAHAGYLLVALVTNTTEGAAAMVFYLFAYTLATVGAFAVVMALAEGAERPQDVREWSGLFSVRPLLAIAMAVFMLALLGFPLAGGMGFFAKWYLLQAALKAPAPQTRLAVLLVITSVISAGYYLYVIMVMFMRPRPADAAPFPDTPAWTRSVIVGAAVLLLALGLYPSPIVRWARSSSLQPTTATGVPSTPEALRITAR
ncbi:NADH-quinone oxidoreductase subunit N [Roseisolibacter sp. H3M3-2]|uniref:NADH-quinone oxidoreductase subunit N n=1 Tax=Roseisolibacter sp. H3M3-2 TaxID=3031323 RepID=UPI0023DAA69E|nr:NADH-quinone oxidoreductase subunit N [Roseisolibacter sp. H3M3-2]MDF1501461.1 NADH-quinone oxidoreductase subunit N [Roseisolibacter sp. H3M3-2]